MPMRRVAIALAVGLALSTSAFAGRSCEQKPMTDQAVIRGLNLAVKTQAALDASGAQVVVLGRSGQDLSKYNLRYSHIGLAYKLPEGWRVMHKLNGCGTNTSNIYVQGLGEFFLDDPWRYEAVWVAPRPDVQQRLQALLANESKASALHEPAYNLVSYVWGTKYQQSNQWAIETLAMAMDPSITTRPQAQSWLQSKQYQPTALTIRAMSRLGGRVSSANVAFDDHPDAKRFSDRIETVTADSVFEWLQRSSMGAAPVVLPE